ncbi:adhesion G-protein coupled receptor F1-like [Mastacembelus armatus]|uniref:adhesion G-protein coupled receptor F1-like n=1 Tax=Mastacembelus armatus TaxID=205130 RepID=UPI000E453FC0|nr:adhesion G-protein coupled receptor F1-like [Mastacembelus armatus]
METDTTSTPPTEFGVDMSVTLDKEYTEGLNDITSPEFKNLTSSIQPVVKRQYKGITGFKRVAVKGFRKGSVITDFVIETTQVNSNEIAEANLKLPEAMKPIAPVIGSVSAVYISAYPISIPDLTYTGSSMTLTCGPPPKDFNVGQISGSVWKFNGLEIKDGGRIKINTTTNTSVLIVNNVINADVGLYECTLRGTVIDFLQTGTVRENQIKQAPIVQLQSQINIECKEGQIQPLECCVQQPYTVQWFQGTTVLISDPTNGTENYCIKYNYRIESCSTSQDKTISFICGVNQPQGYEMTMTLTIFNSDIRCNDTQYGTGRADDMSVIGCDKGQEGSKTAICQETGEWRLVRDTCIITKIKELLTESQALQVENVPEFVVNLSQTVLQDETKVINSSTTISAIVKILKNVAAVSTAVNATVMQDLLNIADVIIHEDATQCWEVLNANESLNSTSELLDTMETLCDRLVGEFANSTQRILLHRTMFNNSMFYNSIINIPNIPNNTFITTITFSTLNNVMPVRNSTFNATNNGTAINAAVVLVKINATIKNVTLSYNKVNKSLTLNPQCVFWNFTLLQNLGAWDDRGCEFVSDINNRVTCRCNHLTSFSLLMATDIPPSLTEALDIITYVGVGISLASLVICLIIEGYVWKAVTRNSTAFMRHVSLVNTALSLSIADICFIIAAAIANNPLENQGKDLTLPVGPCSTATFFMHFFYLALFFWMLVSGLLLFYRTVMVFSHMSKSTMLAIGFSLGYGCPLIIAAITVAVTAPGHGYIRKTDGCWLNWSETKALLALVIPALTIVLINILIVIVVLFKMLRSVGDNAQKENRHMLLAFARCVIILTPLFGLTWSLGVGTMVSSTNKGIHIAFAFFNSLQGFYILLYGTLLDSKVRPILFWTSTGSSPKMSTMFQQQQTPAALTHQSHVPVSESM